MENQPPSSSESERNSSGDQPDRPSEEGAARRGPPPNPLYHPLFLPVLLVGFSLWFFYDGFLTTDPDMLEHQLFNRVMFGITALVCLRVVPRGLREYREDQEAAASSQSDRNSS